MNTEQPRGTNSNRLIRVATREDMLNASRATDIMLLFYTYAREASDDSESPEKVWMNIKTAVIGGNDKVMLLLHEVGNQIRGFMYGYVETDEPDTALIHAAYLPPSRQNKAVIDEALDTFGKWAKYNGVNHLKFYTFRIPGAHRFMLKRGWKHIITSYGKEI